MCIFDVYLMKAKVFMNAGIISAAVEPVMYGSPIKIAVAIILAGIWLWSVVWMDRDADKFLIPRAGWSGGYMAAGFAGVLLWVLLPNYFLGIIVFLAAVVGTFAGYVFYRNGRVNEAFRIFTPQWFASLKGGAKTIEAETKIPLYEGNGRPVILTDEKMSNPMFVMKYNLTQEFMFNIARKRAAEVAVDPAGERAKTVFLIDGMAVEQEPLYTEDTNSIAAFIKELAGLEQKSDKPQKGLMGFDIMGKKVDVEATLIASKLGDKIRLRVLNEVVQTDLEALGLPKKSLTLLYETLEGKGIILVSGLPKCGLTSTLYSVTKKIDPYMRNIVAVEHKPATDLANISQYIYASKEEYRQVLANAIRHDPDVLMIDACLDSTAAELLSDFSANKLVILAIPATEAADALLRWQKLGGNVKMVKVVTSQLLLRKVCTNCRESYPTTPELLEKLRLPANITKFYRTPQIPTDPRQRQQMQYEPCTECNEFGYLGRTGAFEVMQVDDAVRQATQSGTVMLVRQAAQKAKMLTLQEQVFVKVAQGVTTLEEAQRILKVYATMLQQVKGGKAK